MVSSCFSQLNTIVDHTLTSRGRFIRYWLNHIKFSYGITFLTFTTLRLRISQWLEQLATGWTFDSHLAITSFVSISRYVEVIERHADAITSILRNNNATTRHVKLTLRWSFRRHLSDLPVTLWSRRKQEHGHLSSSPLTSAATFVIGLSEQTHCSLRDICFARFPFFP